MAELSANWNQARIEQYVSDGTEESLTLDYKAAASLAITDGKKAEITKDVSAMANSAGGVIIYGVAEYQDKAREHLPEKIDPVDRTQFSREWLEHVISNIQPRIDGIVIHPVPIDTAPNHVVYVIEIPQGHTAHQAKDKRYYKRHNFESVAMEDYEIRDVMGRQQFARIELEFTILIRTVQESSMFGGIPRIGMEPSTYTVYELRITMVNAGRVYGQYVVATIEVPYGFDYDEKAPFREHLGKPPRVVDLGKRSTFHRDNTVRDVIRYGAGGYAPEYGPSRYVPILPGTTLGIDWIRLTDDFETVEWGDSTIRWETRVDNAPPQTGEIAIKNIEKVDRRGSMSNEFDELDDD